MEPPRFVPGGRSAGSPSSSSSRVGAVAPPRFTPAAGGGFAGSRSLPPQHQNNITTGPTSPTHHTPHQQQPQHAPPQPQPQPAAVSVNTTTARVSAVVEPGPPPPLPPREEEPPAQPRPQAAPISPTAAAAPAVAAYKEKEKEHVATAAQAQPVSPVRGGGFGSAPSSPSSSPSFGAASTPTSPASSPLDSSHQYSHLMGSTSSASSSRSSLSSSSSTKKQKKKNKKDKKHSFPYEDRLKERAVQQDPHKDLMLFPSDNIALEQHKRTFRTHVCSVTEEVEQSDLKGYVRDSLNVFTRDLITLRRNYEHFGGKARPPAPTPGDLPPEENPLESSTSASSASDLDPELLKPPFPEIRQKETATRQQNRIDVFVPFSPLRKEQEGLSDPRTLGKPFPPRRATELLVVCKELSFALGEIEPFFASLMLFDVQTKQRLSESFHFNLNSPSILSLLSPSGRLPPGEQPSPETCARAAIFRASYANPNVYLVLRLEKVMQGDVDDCCEPYFKHSSLKVKERTRITKDLEAVCERLGEHTQPFAWAALRVFDESGQLVLGTDTTFRDLIRARSDHNDERLCELIKKTEKEGKPTSKPIPGKCTIDVSLVEDKNELPGRLDPSLLPVIPIASNGEPIVREMQEFTPPTLSEVILKPEPNLAYVNHLYIYPELANLTKNKETSSRNISVCVQLKEHDTDPKGPGMPVVYGTSHRPRFMDNSLSPCTYHNKKPVFYNEVKLKLPSVLTPNMHLFFTFYHIGVRPKNTTQTPCGYAILPLLQGPKLLDDQEWKIPIATSLPSSYNSVRASEHLKWLDNAKPLFNFRTRLISTIYSQDPHLQNFFEVYSEGKDGPELCNAIEGLKLSSDMAKARFFPVLLDQLFAVMCYKSELAARHAFTTICSVLSSVDVLTSSSGKTARNPQLMSYLYLLFDGGANHRENSLHQEICRQWISALQAKDACLPHLGKFSWFFFESVFKSMALYLHRTNQLQDDATRPSRFSPEFHKLLKKLLRSLRADIRNLTGPSASAAADINHNAALFTMDLFNIMDRGFVFELVHDWVTGICPNNDSPILVTYKFLFLRTICDYEHYVPLNLPLETSISSVPTIQEDFWRNHPIAGLLLNEVCSCLTKDKITRLRGITTLRNLLWKHDSDPRYASQQKKQRVATLYFPFIVMVLDKVHTIESMDEDEQQDWLICFMWILRNCNHKLLLRVWWKKEALRSLKAFFLILSKAVESFRGSPLLQQEVGFSTLDVLEEFMEDFARELQGGAGGTDNSGELMENMFPVLILLLQGKRSVSFLLSMFSTLRYFIHTHSKAIFRWKNTVYCSDLSFEILRHCNFAHAAIRSQAAALFFLLIKTNFSETKTFARMRLQSTIAVSRLTGLVKEYGPLLRSLKAVVANASADARFGKPQATQVEELCMRLTKVVEDSKKMDAYRYDPEMTADLYYKVSTGYADSPDLRVTWLDNLCTFHMEQGNMTEAVQCKIHIAALISEYLTLENGPVEGIPTSNLAFKPVSPNMETEQGLPKNIKDGGEEGMYNPKTFSEAGLKRTLKEAISIAKNAYLYELVLDIYKFLIAINQKDRDYLQLGECFKDLKQICEELVKSFNNRLFGNFYRVAFFGAKWGEFDGKQYIYKASETMRLADFSNALKAQFAKKYGAQNVELISNISVNKETMNPDVCYFQVVSVSPDFDQGAEERTSLWEKKFNLHRFVFETPFTKSGKAHSDKMGEQYKRKTVLTTKKAFPYVKSRLPVLNKEEIILSPIENAIDLIRGRCEALRMELDVAAPSTKTLQQVLQGSVLVQVNAGPIEIARTFLAGGSNFDAAHVSSLKESLQEFIKLCQFALNMNKMLIAPDQLEFQVQLEAGYYSLCKELSTYLPGTKLPTLLPSNASSSDADST
ncbi:dedicator of cytokinesis protein 7 isoform X5 [Balamuthia mandrillaris]